MRIQTAPRKQYESQISYLEKLANAERERRARARRTGRDPRPVKSAESN
ncbi:hypothetical protein [Spongiactinospora rosea]|nr:hypothetical protein [Spongiactinospora rosea]